MMTMFRRLDEQEKIRNNYIEEKVGEAPMDKIIDDSCCMIWTMSRIPIEAFQGKFIKWWIV